MLSYRLFYLSYSFDQLFEVFIHKLKLKREPILCVQNLLFA